MSGNILRDICMYYVDKESQKDADEFILNCLLNHETIKSK